MPAATLESPPLARRIDFFSLLDRSVPALCTLAILIMVCGSLGQVTRWDLLEQIAMMDNAANGGSLYPGADAELPHGVSVYFPGVALLAWMIAKMGGGFYVVEIMLFIACAVVIVFLEMLRKAAARTFGTTSAPQDFFPLAIAYVYFICPLWLYYAREFKPDTIAILIGMIGLMTANWLQPIGTAMPRIVAGALLFGFAVVFKQQYVALLFGLALFTIFHPSRDRIIFTTIALISAVSVFYLSYASVSGWYWNITVLADDGLLDVRQIVTDNFRTAAAVIQFAMLGFVFTRLPGLHKEAAGLPAGLGRPPWFRSPWFWISVPAMGAAAISALKVGGNAGNTQLGLILLLPLVHYLSRNANRRVLIALAWCAVISHLTTLYAGPASYLEARRLKAFIQNEVSLPDGVILTGSNVYFASRVLADRHKVVNYWTMDLRNNVDPGSTDNLRALLRHTHPDMLILENWPQNKAAVQENSSYRIAFQNGAGLVVTHENAK